MPQCATLVVQIPVCLSSLFLVGSNCSGLLCWASFVKYFAIVFFGPLFTLRGHEDHGDSFLSLFFSYLVLRLLSSRFLHEAMTRMGTGSSESWGVVYSIA